MTDPYSVLGVSPNASEEEIKTAYKKLAKKYHPDQYIDDPLSDSASEKMREINEAYDKIISSRRAGTGSSYTGQTYKAVSSEYDDVRQLIEADRLDDAEQLLDGVRSDARNAEWNYLKGFILYKRGWLEEATSYFERACSYDPENAEYKEAYEKLLRQRTGVFGGYNESKLSGCAVCNICSSLVCADICCECCGGDLIPCC